MAIYDFIKGFVDSSLVDWDGKVVCVIFLAGCNFRCKFCSNKDLVSDGKGLKTIKFEEIEKHLKKNGDFTDGVVITGGEPTIHKDFPELCLKIKNLGFKVKIDTNGTNPEMLQELLDKKLVEYAAMDVKTSFGKYNEITKTKVEMDKIKKSIEIVKKFPEYEFRTTVFPDVAKEDILEIAKYLKEHGANKKFFIHQFRNETCLDAEAEKAKPYSKEQIGEFLEEIKGYFEKCEARNAV